MTDFTQQIREAQAQYEAALHEKIAREEASHAPERTMQDAQWKIAQLRQAESRAQFEAKIAASHPRAEATMSAARAWIAAVERHDLDGALAAASAVQSAHSQLYEHNRAALGDYPDNLDFQRFAWGVSLGHLLGVPLAGVEGQELRNRQGLIFAVCGQILQAPPDYTLDKAAHQTERTAYKDIVRGGY